MTPSPFTRGGKKHVLETYLKLHEHRIGAHWMWVAIERLVAGEPEVEVMEDYGYRFQPNGGAQDASEA